MPPTPEPELEPDPDPEPPPPSGEGALPPVELEHAAAKIMPKGIPINVSIFLMTLDLPTDQV